MGSRRSGPLAAIDPSLGGMVPPSSGFREPIHSTEQITHNLVLTTLRISMSSLEQKTERPTWVCLGNILEDNLQNLSKFTYTPETCLKVEKEVFLQKKKVGSCNSDRAQCCRVHERIETSPWFLRGGPGSGRAQRK